VPGVIALPKDLGIGELVGIYTLKGEIVGLGQAAMTRDEIEHTAKGIAFIMKRLIMKPDTYPKAWRSKGEHAINIKMPVEIDLDKLEKENAEEF
jgi:H/ACA ribonucleoprotein complex subunit 4